jgi:AcrR family transcriptional regulator
MIRDLMGRRAEQTEETRRLVLAAARALFIEHGYDRTPIEEILRRANVSRGALYHHFPSKEALLEAVFDEIEQEVAARTAADRAVVEADPLGALRAGCSAWLAVTLDPAVRAISLTDAPAVLGWQRWRDIDERYSFGAMKAVLQLAIEAGQIEPQPVDMLAHMLIATLGEAALVIARADDAEAALGQAEATFNRLLDGLARVA